MVQKRGDKDDWLRVRVGQKVKVGGMMKVERVFTNARWESEVGYCRGTKVRNMVFIGGTAPVADDGGVYAPGDAYLQTKRCLEIISKALMQLGAETRNVVRTRMFVTDITRWAEYGRAHKEYFSDTPPVTSMIEVKSLIDPDMLIEIEADAVC